MLESQGPIHLRSYRLDLGLGFHGDFLFRSGLFTLEPAQRLIHIGPSQYDSRTHHCLSRHFISGYIATARKFVKGDSHFAKHDCYVLFCEHNRASSAQNSPGNTNYRDDLKCIGIGHHDPQTFRAFRPGKFSASKVGYLDPKNVQVLGYFCALSEGALYVRQFGSIPRYHKYRQANAHESFTISHLRVSVPGPVAVREGRSDESQSSLPADKTNRGAGSLVTSRSWDATASSDREESQLPTFPGNAVLPIEHR